MPDRFPLASLPIIVPIIARLAADSCGGQVPDRAAPARPESHRQRIRQQRVRHRSSLASLPARPLGPPKGPSWHRIPARLPDCR